MPLRAQEAEQQTSEADLSEHQEEHQGEGERVQRVLSSSNADEEAAAAAAATFDPEAHRQYLELPAWPEADEQALTGSWHFTEQVYDYAASLPMTQVLSWDNPRLVSLPAYTPRCSAMRCWCWTYWVWGLVGCCWP